MYNVNGKVATLVQFNRNDDENIYDDQDTKELDIVVCPYNVDQAVRFGIYTVPEATGYFIIKSKVDVREGDQLIFNNEKYTILKVLDSWLWNKVANISIAVK